MLKEEDLAKQAEEIEREIDDEPEKGRSPLWYVLAIFLALIVVLMAIPYYSIRMDASPSRIPTIEEVVPSDIKLEERDVRLTRGQDYLALLDPTDPVVKLTADRIATYSCRSNKVCQAKANFYFVRDNFNYVSDPAEFDYVKNARESLATKGGDCDDASVLLANLLSAIGIRTQFVFVPGHVYVQARIPDAPRRYFAEHDWIPLDPTCRTCEFGEIHYSYADDEKFYVG